MMSEMSGQDRLIAPAKFVIAKRKLSWLQAAILQLLISVVLWGLIIAMVAML